MQNWWLPIDKNKLMHTLQTHSFNIQLINNTKILFYKNLILVKGTKGIICYSKFKDMQKYTIILKQGFLFINIKNTTNILKLYNLFKYLIFGVNFLFSKKLQIVGTGLRFWVKQLDKHSKVLLIKGGYSQDIAILLPRSITIFCLRQTLLLVRGLNKETVNQWTSTIRLKKKPDKFRGKGLQYKNEVIQLKIGKKK
jgi:large subunit ribosomal protein L6